MLNGLKNAAGADRALTGNRKRRRAISLIALAVAGQAGSLAVPRLAEGASGTWTNNNNGNWSATSNWSGGIVADGADFTANFTTDINATRTVTNDTGGRIIGNLNFTDSSNDWILSGSNALTLNNTTGPSTLTHNSSGRNATISLVLAGAEDVRKLGPGNIILSGANTYTGETSVYNGVLFVGGNAPSGLAGALGNATSAVLLGDTTGSNSAQLLTSGAFTVGRDINVQAGNTGTMTIGGNSANTSIFSGAISLNKSANLTAASGGTVNVTGAISSTGLFGISKVGAGIVNLSVDNGYTGATSITNGTLTVSGALGALSGTSGISIGGTTTAGVLLIDNVGTNNTARFSDTLGVTLTGIGGTLRLAGNATAASTETLGTLTIAGGSSNVQVDAAAAGASLTFSSLVRTGGTVNFSGTGGTLGGAGVSDPRILFTAQAAGLLPRWATVGNNFATYSTTNGVSAFTSYVELPASGFDPATIYQSTVDRTLTESGTIDSLKLNPTAVHTIDLGANNLTLGTGGLISSGAFTTTFNGTGTLGATDALDANIPAGRVVINAPLVISGATPKLAKFGAGVLEINNIATAPGWFGQPVSIEGTLQLGVTGGTGTTPLALSGAVTGTGGLVVTGAGVMSLGNAANTFFGNILVDGGGLAFTGDNGAANDPVRLGTGTKNVTVQNGGRLFLSGTTANFTSGGKSLVIGTGGGTVDIAGTGVSLQLDDAGQFSGTGVLTKTGTGTLHLGNQDFSGFTGGSILLDGGTLLLDRNGGVTGPAANRAVITMAGGTTLALRANGTTGIAFNNNVITTGSVAVSSGSSAASTGSTQTLGTLQIGGASPTITIQNGANINTNSAGSIRFGAATVTGTGSPTFNVSANGSGSNILFLASLDEGASARSFVKSGSGILRIDGAGASPLSSGSSFSVNAGKLEYIAGALGAASVTLNGGTVDLRNNTNGTFNNPLTVSTNGTVFAGLNTTGTTSVTHQASTLSLGTVIYTLSPANFTAASNVAYGLSHTSTTLNGNPTFAVTNQGTGVGTLLLGAVSDGGVARTITKTGAGNLLFGASPALANTVFNINAGGIVVGVTGATGTNPTYNFGDTAANANAAAILAGAGGVTIPEAITVRAGSTGALSLGGINTSGTATFSGPVTLNNNLTVTAAAGGTVEFTNTLAAGSVTPTLTKAGLGTVTLSGTVANGTTAGTTIAAGTLQMNKSPGLGNGGGAVFGPVSVTGTLMNLGNEQVDDAAAVTLNTGGIWNLNGFTETIASLTYNGGAIVNGSGLVISAGAGDDLFLFDGTDISAPNTTLGATARLIYAGSTTLGKISGGLTLSAPQQQFLINDGTAELDAEISGVISGASFSINKTEAGTILLSNSANTFGGAGSTVTVSAGVLRIVSDGSLGDLANSVTLNGGAIGLVNGLNYATRTTALTALGGGFDVATGATATLSGAGVPTGSATLFKSGGGTLTLGGNLVSTGTFQLRGGLVAFDDPAKLGTVASITGSGGGLSFTGGTGTLAKPITIAASTANALTVRGATAADTVTLTGAITGGTAGTTALVVTGPGVTAIANNTANTFAGDILVNGGGILSLVTAAPTGGGTLDDNTTSPSTALESGLGANGKLVTLDNGTFRVAGTTNYNPAASTKSFVIGAGGGTFDLGVRTLTLDDGTTEGANGAQLQGSGNLTVTGAVGGLLQLSNTSNAGSLNFSGNITIGPEVRVQSGSSVGLGTTAGSTLVQAGGQLDFYSSTAITSAESITINGTGPSSGTGSGAGALTNSGNTIVVTLNGPITLGSSSAIGQTGGGVGTMTLSGPIGESAAGSSLTKVGTGTITLGSANSYSGGTIIQSGTLVANTDGSLGATSGGLTFNTTGGALRFGSAFNLNSARSISIAAGATGTFDTNGFDSTISQAINTTATSTVGKSGAGTLTLSSAVTTAAPLNIAAGTLTAAATANPFDTLTMTGGTLNGAGNTTFAGAANFTGPSTITSGASTSVTFNNAVTIGTVAASASLTVGTGSSFVMNAAGSNFIMGNRTTANGSTVNDTFNAAAARNVSITATNIQIGTTSGNPDNTSATAPLLTFTLPTASNSTSTIVASGSIWLGIAENSGLGNALNFNLGGGTNDITTPLISLGGGKTGSIVAFPASGGSLDLKGPANSKTDLIVGNNPDPGTGTNPASSLNLTTTGTVTASLGFLRLGQSPTTTANGGAKGTFTLGASGPNSLVTADSVQLGVSNGNQVQTTSTFNLSAGTFKFNDGGTGFVSGGGTATAILRTTAINISGGLLDMNNLPINAVSTGSGTSTLTLTGAGTITDASTIGNFGTLTFSGGTLRNAGTISRALTQTATTGVSLLDVVAKNTTISGAYTLTGSGANSATANIASGQTLTATSIAINDKGVVKGNGSIAGPLSINAGGNIAPGASVGTLTTAATTWAGGGSYQWELNSNVASAGQEGVLWDLMSATSLTSTATPGTPFTIRVTRLAGATAPDADAWFTIATSTSPITIDPAAFALPDVNGGPNWEIRSADLGGGSYGVQVSAVPEPAGMALLAMAGIGLLARRRRRDA